MCLISVTGVGWSRRIEVMVEMLVPPRNGRQLLESYRVTICNRDGMVYFEKYPEDD